MVRFQLFEVYIVFQIPGGLSDPRDPPVDTQEYHALYSIIVHPEVDLHVAVCGEVCSVQSVIGRV